MVYMAHGEKTGASFDPTDRVIEEGAGGLRHHATNEILGKPEEAEAAIEKYRARLIKLQDEARQAIALYNEHNNADDLVGVYEFHYCGSGADSEYDDAGHLRSSKEEMIERLEEDVLALDYVDDEIQFLRESIERRKGLRKERSENTHKTPETVKSTSEDIAPEALDALSEQRTELERLIGVYKTRAKKEAAGFAKAFLQAETLTRQLSDAEDAFLKSGKSRSELKKELKTNEAALDGAWFWHRLGMEKESKALKQKLIVAEENIVKLRMKRDDFQIKLSGLVNEFPTLSVTTKDNLNAQIKELQRLAKEGSPYVQNLEKQLETLKKRLGEAAV